MVVALDQVLMVVAVVVLAVSRLTLVVFFPHLILVVPGHCLQQPIQLLLVEVVLYLEQHQHPVSIKFQLMVNLQYMTVSPQVAVEQVDLEAQHRSLRSLMAQAMMELLTTVLVVVEVHMGMVLAVVAALVMGLVEMDNLLLHYHNGQVVVAAALVLLHQVLMVVPDFSYQPHIMTQVL